MEPLNQRILIRPFRAERFPVPVRLRPAGEKAQKKPLATLRLRTACQVLVLVPLVASCVSASLTLAPVGPGPQARPGSERGVGELQVYSEPEEYYQDEMSYFPHTDYQLFTTEGKRLRRVWNHNTHDDEAPAVVSLPPGQYVVRARAEFYGWVSVPVVIKPNQLTKVILQPGWKPGPAVAGTDLVQFPNGYPVGWRAQLPGTTPTSPHTTY